MKAMPVSRRSRELWMDLRVKRAMDSAKINRIVITVLIILILAGVTTYLIYDQIQGKPQARVEVAVANPVQEKQAQTIVRTRKQRVAPAPEPMPELDLRKLDGTALKLSDYAGKTVLLNIWSANAP